MFVTIRMPDLAGLDETTARRMVANAGLTLDVEYAYSDLAEGYVCDQPPKANEEVGRGSAGTATISRGSGLLLVPRLTGMTQTDAENVLIAQGLSLGYVEIVPSEKLRGVVLAQSPEAGENAEPGAAVSLTVSGGRVVVPELVGQREEEAVERMASVGLTCGDIGYQNVDSARQDGVVLAQSIDKFTEVLPGSVTLRSETSGVRTWRLYLDGNFKSEATAVLQ